MTPPKLVIAIGASVGGLLPIKQFCRHLPGNIGCALVVIQHLSPDHATHMPELLSKETDMPVILVEKSIALLANHIFLISPGTELTIGRGQLVVNERDLKLQVMHTIDLAFHSMAQSYGENGVAIVMSGMGCDGSEGIQSVYAAGGLVMVQKTSDAEFPAMPDSALKTNSVHHELSAENMPAAILDYLQMLEKDQSENVAFDKAQLTAYNDIIRLLEKQFQLDLSFYQRPMLLRRISRRIKCWGKSQQVADYCQYLLVSQDELNALCKDVLIGVTQFFRDEEAFGLLENKIIPELIENLATDRDLRVWICGCSTGEEVYSVAILMHEAFSRAAKPQNLKIIATDISREAILTASEGLYFAEDLKLMSPRRREKYFQLQSDGRWRVSPVLRKIIVFSIHDVLIAPAFTQIDLVLCRNLLIYFILEGQKRALSAFHFALRKGGVLMLGPSEGLGPLDAEFATLDRQWKLFAKNSDHKLMREYRAPVVQIQSPAGTSRVTIDVRLANLFNAGLSRLAYAGVLINDKFDAVQTFGNIREFLNLPLGMVSNALFSMLDSAGKVALQAALNQVQKGGDSYTIAGLNMSYQNQPRLINIRVEPIEDGMGSCYYWIFFDLAKVESFLPAQTKQLPLANLHAQAAEHIRHVELELQVTREALQATVLQLELSNEELQSTNEELLASNEELQSSNEEVNSVNEELYVANAELIEKIAALDRARADLSNLINSTEIATIFLDPDGNVQLFTPKMLQIFNLRPQDIGRKLHELVMRGNDETLFADCEQVFSNQMPIERQIHFNDKLYYTRRVNVYKDLGGRWAGVVVAYVDITERIEKDSELRRVATALQQVPTGVYITAAVNQPPCFINQAFFAYNPLPETELQTWSLTELLESHLGKEKTASAVNALAQGEIWSQNREVSIHNAVSIGATLSETLIPIFEAGKQIAVVYMLRDVTTQRLIESALRDELASSSVDAQTRSREIDSLKGQIRARLDELERANQLKSLFLANVSHELRTPLNAISGYTYLLAQKPKSPEDARFLQHIQDSADYLLELIEDIIDISQNDSGQPILHQESFGLNMLCQQVLSLVAPMAEANSITLNSLIAPELAVSVTADRKRLMQCLVNLLTNAVKFTEQGSVTFSALPLSKDGSDWVRFEVSDTGIGLTPEELKTLFVPFGRIISNFGRHKEGTGLGLVITKQLVELMGGSLNVLSNERGSTFWFELPLTLQPMPATPQSEPDTVVPASMPRTPPHPKVLIVEDEAFNQELLGCILEGHAREIHMAENGAIALEMLKNESFDLVLMDVCMPVMDGKEATRQIRQTLKLTELPIIGLSANAFDEDIQTALAAGMNEFVTKPLKPALLFQLIEKYCH